MEKLKMGKRIRAIRRRLNLTQAAMAQKLEISASYLNLIENDQRALSANLLIRLADQFDLDLKSLSTGEAGSLIANLIEVFSDPAFEDYPVMKSDIQDLVASSPEMSRAIRHLYETYVSARNSAKSLAEEVHEREDSSGIIRSELFSEQVSDLVQRHMNYFENLELEAARLWRDAKLKYEGIYRRLADYLKQKYKIKVRLLNIEKMGDAVRRFDAEKRELLLSEGLAYESRNFQLAHQIGLLNCSPILDKYAEDPHLTSDASRALFRVALANYFASAVMMPYEDFLAAAGKVRYDIDLLGHRFRCSFEQICHRLTTLRREGAEGVPFSLIRIDIAGNISKKFSIGRFQFPRFSGLCPLRNVHLAFLQPGQIRVQIARLPDGLTYFSIARTVRKFHGGYHNPQVRYSLGLGCDIESAKRLVYADGIDLADEVAAVPVGVTCRLCPRMDCESRAFPAIQEPPEVDENKRGLSFYAPVK